MHTPQILTSSRDAWSSSIISTATTCTSTTIRRTAPQHIAHDHDVSHGSTTQLRNPSDTARSALGYQAELPPSTGYGPNLHCKDHTSNLYVSISASRCKVPATSSETSCVAATHLAESLYLSSNAGREPQRHPAHNEGRQSKKFPTFLIEKVSREVGETCRQQGFEVLHHQERPFEEAAACHRWEGERLLQTETARVAA